MNEVNNNESYRIASFIVYQIDNNSWVVQTRNKINIVTDKDLVCVLEKIMHKSIITNEALTAILADSKNKSQAIFEYLKNNELIITMPKFNLKLSSSIFATNDKKIFNFFNKNYFDKFKYFNNIDNLDLEENQLIVIILNPYNPNMVRRIYKKLKRQKLETSYLLLGYFYNFHFYLDNIYNINLKLPDHFDHIGYTQASLYSNETNYTYQDMVNIIFEKDPNFNLIFPTKWTDLIAISDILMNIVLSIFDMDDSTNLYLNDILLQTNDIDLNTRKNSVDSANYWEMKSDD